MKVQSSLRDDVAILNVSGGLNADSVTKFNEAVIQAREHELRDFIVDVREVTAIGSAGLEALSALQRQLQKNRGAAGRETTSDTPSETPKSGIGRDPAGSITIAIGLLCQTVILTDPIGASTSFGPQILTRSP